MSWATLRRAIKVVLAVALLAGVVALIATGTLDVLSPLVLRDWLREAGPAGAVLFILAFAILQPMGVAGHIWVIAASLVWPLPVAFALSWLGAMAAGCSSFWFGRFVGKDWVQPRVPKRLEPYDERLETDGFRTVLIMRLLFFTFGPMQFMFGVSRVSFAAFLAGSALGLIPLIALETWLGGGVVQWLFASA